MLVACAEMARHHDGGTRGKAHKNVDHEVDKGTGNADGANGIRLGREADYDHVCRVVERLQQIGGHQGKDKQKDLAEDRPLRQRTGRLFCSYHFFTQSAECASFLPPHYSADRVGCQQFYIEYIKFSLAGRLRAWYNTCIEGVKGVRKWS